MAVPEVGKKMEIFAEKSEEKLEHETNRVNKEREGGKWVKKNRTKRGQKKSPHLPTLQKQARHQTATCVHRESYTLKTLVWEQKLEIVNGVGVGGGGFS